MEPVSYDVVIVGGGISGLYTAWRLAMNTSLKVVVLEAGDRFGGRFLTCMMPGGFAADLGAMRILPLSHKLLSQLINEMNLGIEKFYKAEDSAKNTFTGYFRNHKVKDLNDLKRIYDVHEQDMPYFVPANSGIDIKVPENGNVFEGTIGNTELLAKDVSQACYLSLSNNAEVLSKGDCHYSLSITMADLASFLQQYEHADKTHPLVGYHCIKGGFESLIARLLAKLNQMPQVTLLKNSMVVGVDEDKIGFYLSTEHGKPRSIIGKSMVLACNARGIELISWNGPHFRNTQFQRLFSNLEKVIAVKVYLTYQTAWWEDYGLFSGSIETDLPIKEITAFGQRGKSNEFATLLAAFTYLDVGIFEGLNQASYPRFKPVVGDVPQELLPSQVLVDYVQRQLQAVFGVKEMMNPVCAITKIWMSDPIAAANYNSRVGVNTYELQWKALKPFPDAPIYIAGDSFVPSIKSVGAFIGWSEGSLLNSERILVNHFGLKPYATGIPMANEFLTTAKL